MSRPAPRALIFDVFGTLADWRSGVAREAQRALGGAGFTLDWGRFADDWRAQYQPAMEEVRSGARPFGPLDELHRRNLDVVIQARGLDDRVPEALRVDLNQAWHRLDAWPEVGAALTALRSRYLLAPCSNGHIALQVALARRNGWHWDAILGAETAGDYKPKPVVYLSAAAALGCEPGEVMMVAAHSSDLEAAAACGLQTAFVARPTEMGPHGGETAASVPVDASGGDLMTLAETLLR